jgi:conjugative transfer pilus assembly protein TraH
MIGTDSQYGSFSDYAAARQGCGAGGQRDGIIAGAANDQRFKNMLGTEFNLAWQAIQEMAF